MAVSPIPLSTLAAELLIDDVAHLKALADPFRMQIYKALWAPVEGDAARVQPRSAKELLALTGETKTTRIYHHLKLLLGAGIIRKVDQVAHGNLIEDYFAPVARVVRLSPELLEGEIGEDDTWRAPILTMLDEARRDIVSLGPQTRVADLRFLHREFSLTAEDAQALRERLSAVIEAFEARDTARDGDELVRAVVVVYPGPR